MTGAVWSRSYKTEAAHSQCVVIDCRFLEALDDERWQLARQSWTYERPDNLQLDCP